MIGTKPGLTRYNRIQQSLQQQQQQPHRIALQLVSSQACCDARKNHTHARSAVIRAQQAILHDLYDAHPLILLSTVVRLWYTPSERICASAYKLCASIKSFHFELPVQFDCVCTLSYPCICVCLLLYASRQNRSASSAWAPNTLWACSQAFVFQVSPAHSPCQSHATRDATGENCSHGVCACVRVCAFWATR